MFSYYIVLSIYKTLIHTILRATTAEVIIAVGHLPISAQYSHIAERFRFHTDKMAAQRKRVCTSSSQSSAKKAKRQVGVSTFEKWQREFEREYQSLLCLQCDKDEANQSLVATVKCADGLRIVFKACGILPSLADWFY